jgi:hypothetical protein
MSTHPDTGRERSEKELREVDRVSSLSPSIGRSLAASAASERFGKPKIKSGIMKRQKGTLMRLQSSATIVEKSK